MIDSSRRRLGRSLLSLSALAPLFTHPVLAQDAPRIQLAVVEGLSGAFANAGASVLRNIQFAADLVNARGGVRIAERRHLLEVLSFDSKGQLDEALLSLKLVTDRRIPFVLQGNSSAIAAGIIDAVNRHNEREPGNRVVFLNYSAVDPILTQERCSFWHFRFDAHAEMRMAALVEAMAGNRAIRKVYLLNQDYSFGQQVARLARQMITARRPDIEIVGDELHPLGRIKDFAPYASKIKAAGADTVVTGNWGNDLALMVRAARDVGLEAQYYTFYGNSLGSPTAIGESGVGRVRAVAEWHPNQGLEASEPIYAAFRQRLRDPRDDYFNIRHVVMLEMLAQSIEAAGSTEAFAVARAMEGRSLRSPYAVTMRASDHQLITPQVVMLMQRAGGEVVFDVEASGFGFRTERLVDAAAITPQVRCTMQRPVR
jgi:branched-chain amino acid transport system substrate-binding protein